MTRRLFALTFVAATAACDLSPSVTLRPTVVVSPILDSVFVGDSLSPRIVTVYDANGIPTNPGQVTWTVNPVTVASIDASTGWIHGLHKGAALIAAHAGADSGLALVIVSRTLDMTLLMDTVYLLQGDTFTIPLAIQQKVPGPRAVWFDQSPSLAIDTVDTATGLVTAKGSGGPVKYTAHVTMGGVDTVSESGAVTVLPGTDTTGGQFYMTVLGTVIRHEGGPARALSYPLSSGALGFRLIDSLITTNQSVYDKLYLTVPDTVQGVGSFAIDTMNPQEAAAQLGPLNAFCNPPRPWAIWAALTQGIQAFSHDTSGASQAGQLIVTQYRPVAGGAVISGRYLFTAQRQDLYSDSLGVLVVRGTFVAPLVENQTVCPQ